MAALTKDRMTATREGTVISVPVKAATTIHGGSIVAKPASGRAAPATKAENLKILGRSEERADNSSGKDGDINVLVRRGVFRWANASGAGKIAATDIGADAYALDDQTVTKTAAGASKAGKILGVDAEGVWVETR
ncbi:MAG: hypothetical protein OXI22_00820 [Defluviicoccus sp.]|nr:hypothetical protein [Defluviicoccus sp.]